MPKNDDWTRAMPFRMNSPDGKRILAIVREGDYAHPGEADAIARVAGLLPRATIHRILDVGCGRGGTAAWFEQHKWGNVVGIDIDAESIAYARARYPQIEFVHLPVEDLNSLRGDPFDLAYLFNSLYAFSDQAAAVRHIRQICRAGAHLLLFDYSRPEGCPLPEALGSEIGRPIVIEALRIWLNDANWDVVLIDDWTESFVTWYQQLLRNLEQNRPVIAATFGTDWYQYVAGWYGALHSALGSGALGGVVVHAVARA